MPFIFGDTKEQNQAVIQALSQLYGAPITATTGRRSSGVTGLYSNGKYLGDIGTEIAKGLVGPVQGPTQSGATLDTVPQNTSIGNQVQGPTQSGQTLDTVPQNTSIGNQQYGPEQLLNTDQYPSGSQVGPFQNFTSVDGVITPLTNSATGYTGSAIGGPTGIQDVYNPTGAFDPNLSYGGNNGAGVGQQPTTVNSPSVGAAPGVSQSGSSFTLGGTGQTLVSGKPSATRGALSLEDLGLQNELESLVNKARRGILSTILAGNKNYNPLVARPILLGK